VTGAQGEPDPVVAVVVDPVEQQVPALVAQRRVDQVGEASPDQRVRLLADRGGRGPVGRQAGSVGSEGPHAHGEVVEQHGGQVGGGGAGRSGGHPVGRDRDDVEQVVVRRVGGHAGGLLWR